MSVSSPGQTQLRCVVCFCCRRRCFSCSQRPEFRWELRQWHHFSEDLLRTRERLRQSKVLPEVTVRRVKGNGSTTLVWIVGVAFSSVFDSQEHCHELRREPRPALLENDRVWG